MKYLISNNHRVTYTPVPPEMNIAPELQCTFTSTSHHHLDSHHSPTDASRTNVHKNFAIARLQTRFLYQMHLMLRVIECCDVCILRACFSRFQDSELGVIQDFARVIDLGSYLSSHKYRWNSSTDQIA